MVLGDQFLQGFPQFPFVAQLAESGERVKPGIKMFGVDTTRMGCWREILAGGERQWCCERSLQ